MSEKYMMYHYSDCAQDRHLQPWRARIVILLGVGRQIPTPRHGSRPRTACGVGFPTPRGRFTPASIDRVHTPPQAVDAAPNSPHFVAKTPLVRAVGQTGDTRWELSQAHDGGGS